MRAVSHIFSLLLDIRTYTYENRKNVWYDLCVITVRRKKKMGWKVRAAMRQSQYLFDELFRKEYKIQNNKYEEWTRRKKMRPGFVVRCCTLHCYKYACVSATFVKDTIVHSEPGNCLFFVWLLHILLEFSFLFYLSDGNHEKKLLRLNEFIMRQHYFVYLKKNRNR